jgi:hypothetical protein
VHSGGVFGSSEIATFGVCADQPTLQPTENMSTLQPSAPTPPTFEPSSDAPTTTTLLPLSGNSTKTKMPVGGGSIGTLSPVSAAPLNQLTSPVPTLEPTMKESSLRPTTTTGE